jgi:hypothetical protein
LNVKGKSAKKGVLSGFVPFLQISKNEHKHDIEASPPNEWVEVFYRTPHAREEAVSALTKILCDPETRKHIDLENPNATVEELLIMNDDFVPKNWGITMPETVLHEAYIEQEDLTPHAGWETGRESEPAFMDMNFHAIRQQHPPHIVLWQFDTAHPMNPHGLLVSYAEGDVKPVVSDFDAFLIGSKGMEYDALPEYQVELQKWSLERTEEILSTPSTKGWTSRWLQVLHELAQSGTSHELPKYGYGDATTLSLVETAVDAVSQVGAIRHGAEAFNFHFPQELDSDYLIIWDGYRKDDPRVQPFLNTDESGLREFLMARAREGYCFPINPVWPIRDPGWYDVLAAVKQNPDNSQPLNAWYPESSGVLSKIEEIKKKFPDGFATVKTGEKQSLQHSCTSKLENAEAMMHQLKRAAQGEEGKKKSATRREDAKIDK